MTAEQTTATAQPAPVLIITGDADLGAQLRELAPEVPTVTATGCAVAAAHWQTAPAVLIGPDMLAEVCAAQPDNRAGVIALETETARAYLPGVATVPAEAVINLGDPGAPAHVAARVRYLASGGDPGNPPNGCEECGARPGERCREWNCSGTWY